MGRKKVTSSRNKTLSIALTQEEFDTITTNKPKDMRLSMYCRLKLLGEIK